VTAAGTGVHAVDYYFTGVDVSEHFGTVGDASKYRPSSHPGSRGWSRQFL